MCYHHLSLLTLFTVRQWLISVTDNVLHCWQWSTRRCMSASSHNAYRLLVIFLLLLLVGVVRQSVWSTRWITHTHRHTASQPHAARHVRAKFGAYRSRDDWDRCARTRRKKQTNSIILKYYGNNGRTDIKTVYQQRHVVYSCSTRR